MKELHKTLHKELHNADFCVPEESQDVFSRREIESYNDLGLILKRIHTRLHQEKVHDALDNLIVGNNTPTDIEINKSALTNNYDYTTTN